MRRSKHMAKRVKGLKILKIIIILAITFLAGIIVTFCQKQSNPVVTDENRTTQTTSCKSKKHKKAAVAKKETGKEAKISDNINASGDNSASKNSENESDRIERAKKVLDKYCQGEYITGQEAADLDWYCKKYHINPQPAEDDHYVGQTRYDDGEPGEEPEYKTNNKDSYYAPNGADEDEFTEEDNAMVNENSQPKVSDDYQGVGHYGNN